MGLRFDPTHPPSTPILLRAVIRADRVIGNIDYLSENLDMHSRKSGEINSRWLGGGCGAAPPRQLLFVDDVGPPPTPSIPSIPSSRLSAKSAAAVSM